MQTVLNKIKMSMFPPKAPKAQKVSNKEFSWDDVILPPLPPLRGFILLNIIENGQSFTMYEANHDFHGKCIVKAYKPEYAFVAEYELYCFRILRSHPHIITVYDAWEFNKSHYIAMECPDGTLYDLVDLPEKDIKNAVYQIAIGLNHLHKNKIVHFDIKPKNIIYKQQSDGSRIYKLTEFGLAERFDMVYSNSFQCDIVNGCFEKTSLWYRSYELLLLSDEPITEKADVWSLGCIIYELTAGYALFNELSQTTNLEHYKKIVQKGWTHLNQHKSHLLTIALDCLNPIVSKRLSITDVMKRV